jgi:hypothetical protein
MADMRNMINNSVQLLQGYLGAEEKKKEQTRIESTRKKLEEGVNSGDFRMKVGANGVIGFETIPQEEKIKSQQLMQIRQKVDQGGLGSLAPAELFMLTGYRPPGYSSGAGSVKVIGNSLVKYDSETGQATPIYRAPVGYRIFKDAMGAIWQYDNQGKKQKIVDEMGNPVEPTQSQVQPQPTGGQPSPIPTGGRVTVVSPDGKRGSIPTNQLQEALTAGYKQVK